ncbi:alkaline ceramidase 3-like isoform X1 [Asterias amurensis]|uniref:alkaline ceramidase 3-like isoform X1 n=1 Tax=Asterias amurensis TaxID=7602 RepID=UPI003AB5373F
MAPAKGVEGVWGEPTSTLDWCEENYIESPYIAELWNTLSSGIIFVLPIFTMISFLYGNVEVERRFYMLCVGFMTVGLGSWFFHMTLLYESQLFDELPMIWGTCILLYSFFETDSKPNSPNYKLMVILLLYAVSVTGIYTLTKDPVIHQAAYGGLVLMTVCRGTYCFYYSEQEFSPRLLLLSICLYLLAFLLWNIDNAFCDQLKYMRSFIPTPLDVFLQLHAYWHILAALGTHCQIMFSFHARCRFLKQHTEIWNIGCLPLVTVKQNGHVD